MRFLPLGLDLNGSPCLVVGGGAVGTRKVRSLLDAGARVAVVSPEVTPELAAAIRDGRVRWRKEPFRPDHLDGARLVVVATDDPEANALAAEQARLRGTLLCDATSSDRSDVIFGALHEDDGVTIAAFTDGRDPGRARAARDRIAGRTGDAGPTDRPDGTEQRDAGGKPAPGDRPARDDTRLILVAHGSRNPGWGVPLEALTDAVARGAGTDQVRLAYSQFAAPTLEDVVADAAAAGVRRVRVLPLFMTAHGHVERDIRPAVDALRRAHETIEVELLPPVGELASFQKILVELAREVTR